MRIEVKYRDGHHNKHIPAPVLHERIERIRRRRGNAFDPKYLVDDGRPVNAALHPAFEWDDEIAGEKYRIDQASRLIRSVVVIEYDDDDNETKRTEPAYVSIANRWEEGRQYTAIADAMADPIVRESVIEMSRAQLAGWVKRNRNLEENAELAREVEAALMRNRRVKGKAKRARAQPQPTP